MFGRNFVEIILGMGLCVVKGEEMLHQIQLRMKIYCQVDCLKNQISIECEYIKLFYTLLCRLNLSSETWTDVLLLLLLKWLLKICP